MSDLQLIPTDDLCEELLNRFTHGFVILAAECGDDEVRFTRRWKGNRLYNAGQGLHFANLMTHLHDEDAQVTPDDKII